MNREQRRKKAKKNRKNDKISKADYYKVMNSINTVKMVSLLVLRNQGWGRTRISRFSENFNDLLMDVAQGHLSFVDIVETLEEETGLKHDELSIK